MNLSILKLTVAVLLVRVHCRSHGHLRKPLHAAPDRRDAAKAEPALGLTGQNAKAASEWVLFTPDMEKEHSSEAPAQLENDDAELARLRAENAKLKEEVALSKENTRLKRLLTETKNGTSEASASTATATDTKVVQAPASRIDNQLAAQEPVYLKMHKKVTLKDNRRADAAEATTTAAFSWPAEANAATTVAPTEETAASSDSNSDSSSSSAATVATQPAEEEEEEVEIVTAVSNGTNLSNVTIVRPCNCSNKTVECETTFNATEVVAKLQQRAQLSAEAAQAALEGINKIGLHASSPVADQAYTIANQAGKIWEHLMVNSLRTEDESLAAAEQLEAMKRINKRAAHDYSKAVLNVHDFPPEIPMVHGPNSPTHQPGPGQQPSGLQPVYTPVTR